MVQQLHNELKADMDGKGNTPSDNLSEYKTQHIIQVPISAIACGNSHVIALSEIGQVWVWGRGSYGQLGDGCQAKYSSQPKLIQMFINSSHDWKKIPIIKLIRSGAEHCVAVSQTNELYAWGWNEHGNVGCKSAEKILEPTCIKLPIPKSENSGSSCFVVKDIFAGGAVTGAIAARAGI
jgi:alpha-tubulin suppressor-like RCC1 family protein